jgi:addiction module HigA family antidote
MYDLAGSPRCARDDVPSGKYVNQGNVMVMHNPPHPGTVLKGLYLDPLELSVTNAAQALGVTRKTLSQLINGKSGVSTEMALRIAKAFDTTPESWLSMQQAFDLWHVRETFVGSEVIPLMAHGQDIRQERLH